MGCRGYANHVGAHFWNIQDELLGYTEKEGREDLKALDPFYFLLPTGQALISCHQHRCSLPLMSVILWARLITSERHSGSWWDACDKKSEECISNNLASVVNIIRRALSFHT